MDERKTALVIGATGGVGGEIARALIARGWRVRALNRSPETARSKLPEAEWVNGDAMDAASVVAAAHGSQLIVHGANPPGYRNWRGLALPMLESSLAAAKASGARVVFPGTVYNFGSDAGAVVDERAPQHPTTRKGKIRVEMERRLEAAAADGVRTLIVRAGDCFGPRPGANWLSQGLVKAGAPLTRVTYPGPLGVGHAWAYLPDLADTVARLVEREADLAPFEVFHFEGHWFEHGSDIAELIGEAAGRPDLPVGRLPWALVRVAAPFNETMREMLEMAYLWRRPLRLDNRKLAAFLGAEPHTPAPLAVKTALQGLGCLPA